MKIRFVSFFLLAVCLFSVNGKALLYTKNTRPNVLADSLVTPVKILQNAQPSESDWIDSVFNGLSIDQKIGQLFMATTYSNKDEGHSQRIEKLINDYGIGGLIFIEAGNPVTQASMTNRYQALAKIPLLIGFDAEWGLGMRLPLVKDLPKQMTVGAVKDIRLAYRMGEEMAKQCHRVGVHVNFSPVVDVNSNAQNPIIGIRSFGENQQNVALKGMAYARGMQQNGIIACAKHFPGHGDTQTDSHHNLPVIAHGYDRLDAVELYPFRQLIADSVMSIITGHLLMPYYDNKAASISDKIVTKLLRDDLGFQGLIFTDALNMRGITKSTMPGQLDLLALQAGNDVLLMSENVPEAIKRIKEALASGQISQEVIDVHVRKILKAKYFAGLYHRPLIEINNILTDLNNEESKNLKQRIFENAATLVKNEGNILPFASDSSQYVSVAVGAVVGNEFQQKLSEFAPFLHYATANTSDEAYLNSLLALIDSTQTVVVSLHPSERSQTPRKNFGITKAEQDFITRLNAKTKVTLVVFGMPYSLKYFTEVPALLCAYENDPLMHQTAAQILFGTLPAKGRLPVSITEEFREGTGLDTDIGGRLNIGNPEDVGMSAIKLKAIDNVVNQAISQQVFPGCQVLVARKGQIILKKNYGGLTYNSPQESVQDHTLYDLASVTKVCATLQAVMLLYDQKQLDLNRKLVDYLPELKGTNKEEIVIKDVLLHQAGFVAYIPFWERTRKLNGFKEEFYRKAKNDTFALQVADNLWATPAIRDSVWKWIIKSPLINKRDKDGAYSFVYSDLGLMSLQKVIERITKQPLDVFVQNQFYKPLNLSRTGYTPLQKGLIAQNIAPTEEDRFFRMAPLRGTVQDQQAAMLGGVSGHAGLFSNASDLAVLMQMNLQMGFYGRKRFFSPSIIPYFAQKQGRNHRGLGWDKLPNDGESNYISAKVSPSSYGHSGYTGTMVWNDPEKELTFIFLSNRVYPSASNNKINTLKIRRKIQDLVYEAIK